MTSWRSICASALIVAGVAAAGSLAVAAPGAPSNDSYRFYEDALAKFEKAEYKAAIIQLKNAVQLDPGNPSAHLLLGRAYLRVGAPNLAERALQRARRGGTHPDLIVVPLGRAFLLQRKYDSIFRYIRPGRRQNAIDAEVHSIRGRAHLALRQFVDAENSFNAARRLRPDAAFPLLGLARIRFMQGRLDEAEPLVDKAIRLAPNYSEAWHEKADVLRAKRDFPAALEHYSKAIALQPANIPARLGRAGTLIDLLRDREAEPDIAYVRENAPRETRAAYLYSVILKRAGRRKEANEVLADAEQLLHKRDPDFVRNHPPSLLLMGVIGHARGNYDEAYKYLTRYLEIDPNHAGTRKLVGSILMRREDAWGAIRTLRPAVPYAPRDPEIYSLLGSAYLNVREYSKATEMYEKAVAYAPARARIRTQLGLSRLRAGQERQAIEDLKTALSLEPDGSNAGLLLGLVYLKGRKYDEALSTAEAMLKNDSKDPVAHNLVGAVKMATGDARAARASFQRALATDPAYAPAIFNLVKLDMAAGQVEKARKRLLALLKVSRSNKTAMAGMARIALSQGELEEATDWLKRVVTADPDAIDQQVMLVDLYLRQGQSGLAVSHARDLELRHPSSPSILGALGRAMLAERDYRGAARRFRRMAQLVGNSPQRLRQVAILQARARDNEGARATLRKAIAEDPENLASRIALIRFETRAKNIDAALALALDLHKTNPEDRAVAILAGDLLMRVRRYPEALAAYDAAMARKRDSAIVKRIYLARYRAGKKEKALANLEGWVAKNPKDISARRLLASAYRRAGRSADAIRLNEKLLAELPSDPALLNNLAGLYQTTGDSRALSYAEKAYRLAPKHAATLDTYGWILVQRGEASRGLELLRRAFTRAANNNEIRYHLAVALSRQGRRDEARDMLRAALENGDEFVGIADARALLRQLSKR